MPESGIFKKLKLDNQQELLILNAPESFEKHIENISELKVHRTLSGADSIGFSLAFVTKRAEVDSISRSPAKRAQSDAVIWFAYPNKSSRRYQCDFSRDTGWDTGKARLRGRTPRGNRLGLVRHALPAPGMRPVFQAGCQACDLREGKETGGQSQRCARVTNCRCSDSER